MKVSDWIGLLITGQDSDWITDSFKDHNLDISKYNHLLGSSYMKLPKEIGHARKVWLIFKILKIMSALNGV